MQSRRALVPLIAAALASLAATAAAQTETFVAQQRYDAAMRAYEAGEHEAALVELRASFAVVRSPNTQLMIARALRNLGRFAEALMEYDLAANLAADRARTEPRFTATREAAEEESRAIRDRVGYVRVSVAEAVDEIEVWVGSRQLPREAFGLPVPIDAGVAVIRARGPGRVPFEREVEVVAGRELAIPIALTWAAEPEAATAPAPREAASSSPSAAEITGWSAGIVALVAGSVGVGLLVAAQTRFDDLAERCGAEPCSPALGGAVSEGRAFEAGLYAMIAVSSAAIVTAIVAFAMHAGEGSLAQALSVEPEVRF